MTLITLRELGQAGRLGNQLFQIASTIGLARRHGYDVVFPRWDYEPFFNVPSEMFVDEVPADAVSATELVPHIDERARIYLQDINLFWPIIDQIRSYFAPTRRAEVELDIPWFNFLVKPVVSVHVRRGDNVPGQDPGTPNKHLWHPLPPLGYYLKAIEKVGGFSWTSTGSTAFFSDEIDWVRANIPPPDSYGRDTAERVYYHDGTTRPKEHEPAYKTAPVLDWIDFHLQARCTGGHVLSNSTFGIMAAIVAGDEHAVYPWPVFGPKLNYINARLLFPDGWLGLETAKC